ncbi:MAG: ATPase domain-containing protein [Nitrososphaerota archaeon]
MSALEGLIRMVLEFMETGIPGAERLLRGFPRGSLIVVRGTPGTGKTVFGGNIPS